MGYDTDYKGCILFEPATPEIVKFIYEIVERTDLHEDPDYPHDWHLDHMFSSLDLELDDNEDGLWWQSGERSYDLDDQINVLVHMVRKKFPDFRISGGSMEMLEECEDPKFIIPRLDGTVMRVEAEVVPKMGPPALEFLETLWGAYGAVKEEELQTDEKKVFRRNFRDAIDAMSDQMHGKRCDNCAPYIDID